MAASRPAALPFIDMRKWDRSKPPARQWLVVDYIPLRQVTLLSGAGGVGKSTLMLQLLVASALRREWIGALFPKHGPTIYLGAEDEEDEIYRRLAAILKYYDAGFVDLVLNGFRPMSFAGKNAALATFGRDGMIKPTPLFDALLAAAVRLQPSIIDIDTVADTFLGDEIKRDQVRQFCSLLRKLAIAGNSAVVLNSHPSMAGIKSGSGLSGSTHWHNSVRARAYFRQPEVDEEDDDEGGVNQPDDGRRELIFMKNQYGPLKRGIDLCWTDGLWLPPGTVSSIEDAEAREIKAEDTFLVLLRRYDREGRNVSAHRSPTYAPAVFAKEVVAKQSRIGKRAFEDAMSRLFEAKRLRVVTDGPPSKQRSRIVELAPSNGGYQQASDAIPTATN